MAEIMEEDKVCTVYVVGEDVKEEITENQGMVEHYIHIHIHIQIHIKNEIKEIDT